ncbi:MAG: PAS domain-containing protein [Candidatus Methanoplasma sp.]|jgi:transcriptional regulator with PAS, ATPase and Fis domain|nr:PAS domain-containing protein [Candidatus Methanoplasma sp.]
MSNDDVSAENLLNLILDEVDDMIVLADGDRTVVWMNASARKNLDMSIDEVVGQKCYRILGSTCCCDDCIAENMIGGPRHCGCEFTMQVGGSKFECCPVPYRKDGKLKIVVQHIRAVSDAP